MTESDSAPKQPKKASSVRHTRAIQRDRTKRAPAAPPDEQVTQRLTELIRPATFSTVAFYYDLGLRQRLLTLPIMVALVLTMIWRQVGAVRQLVHLLNTEGLFLGPADPGQPTSGFPTLAYLASGIVSAGAFDTVAPTPHPLAQA